MSELDEVYCAWLIKWIIKGEIIQLCLTKWWIISGTSRYWVSIRRYCLVLGGTGSVKTGTAWYYMVQGQHRACMPVYIGKSGDLVGWHRCLTYSQTTEYRATQLVSSIKFKMSHAILFWCWEIGFESASQNLWRHDHLFDSLSPTHLLYQLSTNIRTIALQLVIPALVGGRLVL